MTSFNVEWSSGKKSVTGKVFGRKRKVENAVEKGKKKVVLKKASVSKNEGKSVKTKLNTAKNELKVVKKKVIKKSEVKVDDIMGGETGSDTVPKLIKRKKKKEKLAAKLAAEQGIEVPQTNLTEKNVIPTKKRKEIHIKPNRDGKGIIEEVFSFNKSFNDLNIHKHIVSNLEKIGFTKLTTVQEKSIPAILTGQNVLIRSQTGSGKTLAYAVPVLNALQSIQPKPKRIDGVHAIIICPTRELVLQTYEIFNKINTFQWIVAGYLTGGENRNTEKARLRKGIHLLISTPGRLLDHLLHTVSFKTVNVKCLVLDEADRLLDMGFKKDIVKIVEELDNNNTDYDPLALVRGKKIKFEEPETENQRIMPLLNPSTKTRQTILLSATLTKSVAELADFTMKEHIYIDALDELTTQLNSDLLVIPNSVEQKFILTDVKHRLSTLSALLIAQAEKLSKVFLFMGTSIMVDFHYELFTKHLVKMPKGRGKLKSGDVLLLDGFENDDEDEEETVLDVEIFKLHGNMEQGARKEIFSKFRSAKGGILICTDVVSRGIDVPTADCIIQYNGPQSVEDYLHRVGRTGRAGKFGVSYIFLTHEEQDFITELEKHKIFLQQEHAEKFTARMCDLMQEENPIKAAVSLRKHYENSLSNDKTLHKLACMAYSSWSRFYNAYSKKVRHIFDFKKLNLGHHLATFAVKETPTEVARIVKGQVSKIEQPKLNRKLALHEDEKSLKIGQKRKVKSFSLTTSEFSSGLQAKKKKKKKEIND